MPPPSAAPAALRLLHEELLTSIGDDAAATAVAWHAGLHNFRRHTLASGVTLSVAPASDAAGRRQGTDRLAALLLPVARPLLAALAQAAPVACTHAVFVLPPHLPGDQARLLMDSVLRSAGSPPPGRATMQAVQGGSEAGFAALQALAGALAALGPGPRRGIVFAVDSLCDEPILHAHHRQGWVHGPGRDAGWIAGEAAAALAFEPLPAGPPRTPAMAPARQLAPTELLLHPACASGLPDASERWPADGKAGDGHSLQQTLEQALARAGMQLHHISHLVHDHDGSAWRAQDLGAALQRIGSAEPHAWEGQHMLPAQQLGQLGAAWGAVQIALLARLHRLGLQPLNTALCHVQDRGGRCGAAVLERGAGA